MNPRIKSMTFNIMKQTTTNQNKKKRIIQKTKNSLSSLWDNFKRSNIHIIGVPEGEEKEREIGKLPEKNNERKLP